MSYFGRVAERSSRASIGFISLAGTRTPSGYSPCEPLHRRMPALPSHPQGALQDHLQAVQQHPVPLLLQRRPAPLDRIVLAVVRRIVHQADLQPRPVRELHHPLQELRPSPRVLRAVVQVDHQPLDRARGPAGPGATTSAAHRPRRRWSRASRTGASTPRSPPSGCRTGPASPSRAGRDPSPWSPYRRSRSGFFPPGRNRPGPPSPSCPSRSPASRDRPGPAPAPPSRWRRSRRSPRSSSAACPSGSA